MFIHTTTSASSTQKQAEGIRQPNDILGKDDFLKLLTTQLRYQDPIDPVEDKEFIAQLAQFSSLEQMQNLNTNMHSLMESQQKLTALSQATTMLGKNVEIFSNDDESLFGQVTGVQFINGWPQIIVDGKLFDFTEVVSIIEGSVVNGS